MQWQYDDVRHEWRGIARGGGHPVILVSGWPPLRPDPPTTFLTMMRKVQGSLRLEVCVNSEARVSRLSPGSASNT